MKARKLPFTQEYLKSILDYSIITGNFYWKINKYDPAKVGKIAGFLRKDNYWQIKIQTTNYISSRLAWFWITGEDPLDSIVDHIDPGRRFDNSWINLRKATYKQNLYNRRCFSTLGFKGVSYRGDDKYEAKVTLSLGIFKTPEEAHKAYCEYAQEMYGEFFRAN